MAERKLILNLNLRGLELADLKLPAGYEVVSCSFLDLDQVKPLLPKILEILINLNDLSKTEPLDAYTLRSWRQTFSDVVAATIQENGRYASLVGYAENGDWNMAQLGLSVGVRELRLTNQLSQSFEPSSLLEENSPLPENVVSMPAKPGVPEEIIPQNAIPFPVYTLEGQSSAIEKLRGMVRKCAPMDTTLLIMGESGVGKLHVAKTLHEHGRTAEGRFVICNCSELTAENFQTRFYDQDGYLESSKKGTLYLDHVDVLSMDLQGKLVKVLEDVRQAADPRILASSEIELRPLCEAKSFREDLYFRLNIIEIFIPPLRQRRGDLEGLCDSLLSRLSRRVQTGRLTLEAQAFEKLFHYDWPGNIRELESVLEHALLMATSENRSTILVTDLPEEIQTAEMKRTGDDSLKEAVRRFEREHIHRTLARFQGSKEGAAHALGVSLASLYRKLGSG